MSLLIVAFSALLLALFAQILVVRIFHPRNHALVITLCFAVSSLAAMATFYLFARPSTDTVELISQTARLGLLLLSITLAHIATYSAIEDDSPSMAIVKMVWDAGERGCSESELSEVMGDDLFLTNRIHAMKRDGWINADRDRLTLTPLGKTWATLFANMQSVLRMDEGG